MTSTSEPYVYTDLPESLDDIEIKENGDGFEIRLNQPIYPVFGENVISGDESEHFSSYSRSQDTHQVHRSQLNESVLQGSVCGDGTEMEDAKKVKRKATTGRESSCANKDMSQKFVDNIFERMWLTEDVVEKEKLDPTVTVKEEKLDIISVTDESTQESEEQDGNGSSDCLIVGLSTASADAKNSHKTSVSGAVGGSKMNRTSSRDINNRSTPQKGQKTQIATIVDIVLSSDEECSNNGSEDQNAIDYTFTKYDLIKMRRARAIPTTTVKTRSKAALETNPSKGKGSEQTSVSSDDYDTNEEADDEDSDDDNDDNCSEVSSDETETYSQSEGSQSSDEEANEGDIQCPKCTARFKDVAKLKVHMLSHFSEKSYQCKVCMKAFNSNANLKRHVKFHERGMEWKCKKCKKGFPSQKELEMHSAKEHPAFKRYKCTLCKECFPSISKKEAHMMQHIKDTVENCDRRSRVQERKKLSNATTFRKDQEGEMVENVNKIQDYTVNSDVVISSKIDKLPERDSVQSPVKVHCQRDGKQFQPNQNTNAVKRAALPKTNLKTQAKEIPKPSAIQKSDCHEEDSGATVEAVNTMNRTSTAKVSDSIMSTPPPVHKPCVSEIGRKTTDTSSFEKTSQCSSKNKNDEQFKEHGTEQLKKLSSCKIVQKVNPKTPPEGLTNRTAKNYKHLPDTDMVSQYQPKYAVGNPYKVGHIEKTKVKDGEDVKQVGNMDRNDKSNIVSAKQSTKDHTLKANLKTITTRSMSVNPSSQIVQDTDKFSNVQEKRHSGKEKEKLSNSQVMIIKVSVHNASSNSISANAINVASTTGKSKVLTLGTGTILSHSAMTQNSTPALRNIDKKKSNSVNDGRGLAESSSMENISLDGKITKRNNINLSPASSSKGGTMAVKKSKFSAADSHMFTDDEDTETPAVSQRFLDHLDEITLDKNTKSFLTKTAKSDIKSEKVGYTRTNAQLQSASENLIGLTSSTSSQMDVGKTMKLKTKLTTKYLQEKEHENSLATAAGQGTKASSLMDQNFMEQNTQKTSHLRASESHNLHIKDSDNSADIHTKQMTPGESQIVATTCASAPNRHLSLPELVKYKKGELQQPVLMANSAEPDMETEQSGVNQTRQFISTEESVNSVDVISKKCDPLNCDEPPEKGRAANCVLDPRKDITCIRSSNSEQVMSQHSPEHFHSKITSCDGNIWSVVATSALKKPLAKETTVTKSVDLVPDATSDETLTNDKTSDEMVTKEEKITASRARHETDNVETTMSVEEVKTTGEISIKNGPSEPLNLTTITMPLTDECAQVETLSREKVISKVQDLNESGPKDESKPTKIDSHMGCETVRHSVETTTQNKLSTETTEPMPEDSESNNIDTSAVLVDLSTLPTSNVTTVSDDSQVEFTIESKRPEFSKADSSAPTENAGDHDAQLLKEGTVEILPTKEVSATSPLPDDESNEGPTESLTKMATKGSEQLTDGKRLDGGSNSTFDLSTAESEKVSSPPMVALTKTPAVKQKEDNILLRKSESAQHVTVRLIREQNGEVNNINHDVKESACVTSSNNTTAKLDKELSKESADNKKGIQRQDSGATSEIVRVERLAKTSCESTKHTNNQLLEAEIGATDSETNKSEAEDAGDKGQKIAVVIRRNANPQLGKTSLSLDDSGAKSDSRNIEVRISDQDKSSKKSGKENPEINNKDGRSNFTNTYNGKASEKITVRDETSLIFQKEGTVTGSLTNPREYKENNGVSAALISDESQQSKMISKQSSLSEVDRSSTTTLRSPNTGDEVDDYLKTPSECSHQSQDSDIPDNVMKMAKVLTGIETKETKLTEVIKQLLESAPKEEKAEIRKLMKEQGLSEEARKPKELANDMVKRFEAKTYNGCNFFYQSSINEKKRYSTHNRFSPHITIRHKNRGRSRSRSRSRDRHHRKSPNRDRHGKKLHRRSRSPEGYGKYRNEKRPHFPVKAIVRRSPPRYRSRSRSPVRRSQGIRSPDYRRHRLSLVYRRPRSPPRRQSHSTHSRFRRSRSRSRSPRTKRRRSRSRSAARRGSVGSSHNRRRSVSPKRNSRSKDILRDLPDTTKSHKSKLPSHERERESRPSCNTERSSTSRSSREYNIRTSKSSEKDKNEVSNNSKSSESIDKPLACDHGKDTLLKGDAVQQENEKDDPITNSPGKEKSGNSAQQPLKQKQDDTLLNQHEPSLCAAIIPFVHTDEDKCGYQDTSLKAKQSELYDPWNVDDDTSSPEKETLKSFQYSLPSLRKNQQSVQIDKLSTTDEVGPDGTDETVLAKSTNNATEEWKRAWYQKVDNKKLIYDTIENDSYGKNHQEQYKVLVRNKGQIETEQQMITENDDVFLPMTATANQSSSLQHPKSKWDQVSRDQLVQITTKELPAVKTVTSDVEENLTLHNWTIRPQTTVAESNSLFKGENDTNASPKPKYADFKVTIQNTAQFISVMESPASPDADTSKHHEVQKVPTPSQKRGSTSENAQGSDHVRSENEGIKSKHKVVDEAVANLFSVFPSQKFSEKTDVHAETKVKNKHCFHKKSSTYKKISEYSKVKLPSQKIVAPKDQSKASNDTAVNVNDTLKQLHSTLMKLTKCTKPSTTSTTETKLGKETAVNSDHSKPVDNKGNNDVEHLTQSTNKTKKILDPRLKRISIKSRTKTASTSDTTRNIENGPEKSLPQALKQKPKVPLPVTLSTCSSPNHNLHKGLESNNQKPEDKPAISSPDSSMKHNPQDSANQQVTAAQKAVSGSTEITVAGISTTKTKHQNSLTGENQEDQNKYLISKECSTDQTLKFTELEGEEANGINENPVTKESDMQSGKQYHSKGYDERSPDKSESEDKMQTGREKSKSGPIDSLGVVCINTDKGGKDLEKDAQLMTKLNETVQEKNARSSNSGILNTNLGKNSNEEIHKKNTTIDPKFDSKLVSDHGGLSATSNERCDFPELQNTTLSSPRKRHHSSDGMAMTSSTNHDDMSEEAQKTKQTKSDDGVTSDRGHATTIKMLAEKLSSDIDQAKDKRSSRLRENSSGGSGTSTPTLDEKHNAGGGTQVAEQTENKDTLFKETNSFYLDSQLTSKTRRELYDKERGIWTSPVDAKRYWTKHPGIKDSNTDETEYTGHSPRYKSGDRQVSPLRKAGNMKKTGTSYRCNDCYKWFDSYFELNVHKVLHHGHGNKKVYTCQICHNNFRYHEELDRHISSEHKRGSHYICTHCSDTFNDEEKLKHHTCRKHGGPKTHEYSDFLDSPSKSFHNRRHARDTCPDLVSTRNYRYAESSYPDTERYTDAPEPIRCHICHQRFPTAQNLRNHIYARHRKSIPRPHSGWIRTPYKGTDTYRRHKLPFHQHSAWRKRRYDDRSSADGEDYNVSEESYVSSSSKSSPPRVGSPSRKERMSPKYSSDNSNRGLQENQTSLEDPWKAKKPNSETPKDYQCALCEKAFSTKADFSTHLRKHLDAYPSDKDDQMPNTILESSKTMQRSETSLQKHLGTHKAEDNFGDPTAALKNPTMKGDFKQSEGEERQSANVKQAESSIPQLPDDVLKRQCPVCEKVFATEWTKQRHMYLHSGERPFQCTVQGCFKSFVQKSDLKSHKFKVHTQAESRKKRCPWCPLTFKYDANYQAHMKIHKKPNGKIAGTVKCNLCEKLFTSNKAMMNHKNKKHTSKDRSTNHETDNYEARIKKICQQCGIKFLNEEMYKTHMLAHKGINPYQCTIGACQRAFGNYMALKRHIRHVHGDQEPTKLKRVCDDCGAMFLTLKGFENHKLLHQGENPYKCTFDDCQKLFADSTALKRHQNHVHMYSTTGEAVRGSRLVCTECGSIFYNGILFDQHMKIHGIGAYTCPRAECSRTFQDINDLQDHLKKTEGHDNEIIWKDCRQCEEKFLTQHQADKHREREHSKSLIFKCTEPGCTSSYVNSFGLRRHYKSRHQETKNETLEEQLKCADIEKEIKEEDDMSTETSRCEVCSKTFENFRALKIHQQKVHGKKIFQCKLCPMVFTRNDSLLIHVHRHNNINPYKCQICKETFLLRAERDKHRTKEHSAEMSLGCPKMQQEVL